MKHFRRWGAVWILLLLFLGSWAGQWFAMLAEFRSEQRTHGEPFVWDQFLHTFWAATFENWQSEWFQLIFQAVLLLGAKHWLFRVDAEDLERVERKVDAIAEKLGLDPDKTSEPQPQREHDTTNER